MPAPAVPAPTTSANPLHDWLADVLARLAARDGSASGNGDGNGDDGNGGRGHGHGNGRGGR